MPKYYCDYCDTYLTHDSPSVRKTHCQGRKHKENVKFYYQKWMEDQAQQLIDATTALYKAGKITNPFTNQSGAAIPPPTMAVPPGNMPPITPMPVPPGVPQGMLPPFPPGPPGMPPPGLPGMPSPVNPMMVPMMVPPNVPPINLNTRRTYI